MVSEVQINKALLGRAHTGGLDVAARRPESGVKSPEEGKYVRSHISANNTSTSNEDCKKLDLQRSKEKAFNRACRWACTSMPVESDSFGGTTFGDLVSAGSFSYE